jgi:glycosyltransferase involved in cell wall biosynthesis
VPRATIILPTYNNEHYLEEAIESVLRQTFNDFKLLIINDASTDSTSEILNRFDDERIEIIEHTKNQGLIACLNEGLKKCDSEFCARMDGDDIIHHNKLKRQIQYLVKNGDVAMCGTRMKAIGSFRRYQYPTNSEIIKTQLLVNNVISHPSLMWRQKFFADNNLFYDKDFVGAEDYELWTRAVEKGKITNLPKTFYYYRLHKDRETIKKSNAQTHNFARVVAREIDKKWPKTFDSKELIFLFDFNQKKSLKDLQKTEQVLEQILTLNKSNPHYKQKFLEEVLLEKWLACCSAASYLGVPLWKLWKASGWAEKYQLSYSSLQKRIFWFYYKTHRL